MFKYVNLLGALLTQTTTVPNLVTLSSYQNGGAWEEDNHMVTEDTGSRAHLVIPQSNSTQGIPGPWARSYSYVHKSFKVEDRQHLVLTKSCGLNVFEHSAGGPVLGRLWSC